MKYLAIMDFKLLFKIYVFKVLYEQEMYIEIITFLDLYTVLAYKLTTTVYNFHAEN